MSDLNTLIESWKRSLADLSAEQADEVEDHLRSEIDALGTRGELTAVEAFTVAAMRVGRPTELAEEFDRADAARAWSLRLRWMVLGFLGCMALNAIIVVANTALGMALIVRGVSTPAVVALRILSLSLLIAVAIMLWHVWLRRRDRRIAARPPKWLTSFWALAVALLTLPWLNAVQGELLRALQIRNLTVDQIGRMSISSMITYIVLPFTAPLILFIAAVSLNRQRNARQAQSEG